MQAPATSVPVNRTGWVKRALWTFCAFYIVLAFVGAARHYSPVPFWDMWDGFLQNHLRHGSILDQHNEHRIVLARLLFLLDLRWFGGASVFLIACNLLLLAATGIVLVLFLRERGGPVWILGPLVVAWMFTWAQRENITWAFQSQFILATLLPLLALYQAARATRPGSHVLRHAVAAGVLAAAAALAMANGVLAMPVLTAYGLAARWPRRRVLLLAAASALVWILYFVGYSRPGQHGSAAATFLQHPVETAHYVALYLGTPFFFAFGGGEGAKLVAAIAGAALVVLAVGTAVSVWRRNGERREAFHVDAALLAFLGYLLLTALITAGGRVVFGVDQALASRYATPALAAWAAVLVLWSPRVSAHSARVESILCVGSLALLLCMLPQQLAARKPVIHDKFEKMVAALALELGVRDETQIRTVYHTPEAALQIAEPYIRNGESVFGLDVLRGMRSRLGGDITPAGSSSGCVGYVDRAKPVPGDPRFLKVEGWMFDPALPRAPNRIEIGDLQGHVLGFAISGAQRGDVAAAQGRAASLSGYTGYILRSGTQAVVLVEPASGCRLTIALPGVGGDGP